VKVKTLTSFDYIVVVNRGLMYYWLSGRYACIYLNIQSFHWGPDNYKITS